MNTEALDRAAIVEAVTKEVMSRLSAASAAEASVRTAVMKQAVILATEPVPAVEQMLAPHYQVRYYEEALRDCDVLIIPKVCIQLLANLANAISAGPRERFVMTMLLKGKSVIVLEEGLQYRKYKASAPVLLYKQYDSYVDKLKSYGVRMMKEAELQIGSLDHAVSSEALIHGKLTGPAAEDAEVQASEAMSVSQPIQQECSNDRCSLSAPGAGEQKPEVWTRKVLTEAELKKLVLQRKKEIVIDRHCIITPLAQDYLRMQRMHVHRR